MPDLARTCVFWPRIALGAMLGFALFAPLSAQSAPGNGTDFYFSTSLPLRGSGQPPQGRIFKIGVSTPFTLVASVPNSGFPPVGQCLTPCLSNNYNLFGPELSRGAVILAYTGKADCEGALCFHYGLYRTTVQGLVNGTFGGVGRLSGNGRYLVHYSSSIYYQYTDVAVSDLFTGVQTDAGAISGSSLYTAPESRVVADDGTFAVVGNAHLNVFRNGKMIVVPLAKTAPSYLDRAVIDSSGQTVMYQACCSPYYQLRVFRPDTNEDALFLKGDGNLVAPAISADGRQVVFQSQAQFSSAGPSQRYQLWMANIDGSGLRALTSDPDGIDTFALSDDGQAVWYFSGGAWYRLNTVTGEAHRLLPPTVTSAMFFHVVPGSAVTIYGGAFGSDVRVAFDGVQAPILSRTGTSMVLQVPWEVPAEESVMVSVENGTPSPFEALAPFPLKTLATYPEFATPPIHQDWSGYVTRASPAHAGEIVYFYATGLGPVQPPVPTGVPAPAAPLSLPTTPPDCNLPVAFAGLAPGLVGYYLMYFQLPSTGGSLVHVVCSRAETDIPFEAPR
jgi:uncharacterized protein (TIGR03437 family)